jgi:hypothetical protein
MIRSGMGRFGRGICWQQESVGLSPKHPGMHLPAGHRADLGESGEKESSDAVVMENRFSPVAARHHAWSSDALRDGGW